MLPLGRKMGFRYRKTISLVPGVRININRHGFSTTIGPRGANINIGPHGTFANASIPGTGVSYRTRIDNANSIRNRPRSPSYNDGPLPTDMFLIPGTKIEYGSPDVSQLTSRGLDDFKKLVLATRNRRSEIQREIVKVKKQLFWSRIKRIFSLALFVGLMPSVSRNQKNAQQEYRQDLENLIVNLSNTKVAVDIDTDTEIGAPFRLVESAFTALAESQMKWAVLAEQLIDRVKARSWAGTIVSRKVVSFWRGGDPLIETRIKPLAFGTLKQNSNLYFYPGFILVSGTNDFALIDLLDLECKYYNTSFCESNGFPGDALVIGHTWAKANKDGSRDRRFSNNRQLPIVKYGSLHFMSSNGLNEAYLISRSQPCIDFGNAVATMKQTLAKSYKQNANDKPRLGKQ